MQNLDTDELYVFAEDNDSDEPFWKVLLVDADEQVHQLIKTLLSSFHFEDQKLQVISAYSTDAAVSLLDTHFDIALVLYNFIPTEDQSGLKLVRHLREEMNNSLIRIIISTSDSNYALENDLIFTYDINDYIVKPILTSQYLYKTVTIALRIYKHLQTIENNKLEMENIIRAANLFVPKNFLKILHKDSIVDIESDSHIEKELTVLFLDIRSFTSFSEFSTPQETFDFVNNCMKYLEPCIIENNGFIDKYTGDGFMALFPDSAEEAVKSAISMLRSLEVYNFERLTHHALPIEVGIAINTGSVILGAVGFKERIDCTVLGDTVNIASRIEKCNKLFSTNILVSKQTLISIANPQQFYTRYLGKIELSGKRQRLSIYEVFDGDTPNLITLKQDSKEYFEKAVHLFDTGEFLQSQSLFNRIYQKNRFDFSTKYFLDKIEGFLNIEAKE